MQFFQMLMNHKNFDFTQIPDITNDVIFLKDPKTMFFGHFWPFLPDGNFFQKIQLCHTQLYMAPNIKLSFKFSEKTNKSITRKLSTRRKDGQTDPIL